MQKVSQWVGMSLVGLFVLATTASGAGYKMKIEFPGYDNRTEALTNFPVLVVISNDVDGSGFSFENTPFLSDEGWDLRFRDTDETTELNYEIESWDTNNASYVWVQVPELPADGSGHIWAYWGQDDTQQPCTTNGAVWSAGYAAVWHFAGDLDDSSSFARDATNSGSTDTSSGRIANGRNFDGTDDYATVVGYKGVTGTDPRTITAWVKTSVNLVEGGIVSWGVDSDKAKWTYRVQSTNGKDGASRIEVAGGYHVGNTAVNDGEWYHVALTFIDDGTPDVADTHLYVNSEDDGSSDTKGCEINTASDADVRIGTDFNDRMLGGTLDELRISSVARSPDWIWADYMSVASNLVFSDYGSVAPLDADVALIRTDAASGLATNGATVNGTLTSTGTSVTAVSVYWEQTDTDQGTNTTDWANVESFGDYSPAMGDLPYSYATNITGLAADTQYTYRYYATNDFGEAWGAAESFTTYEAPGVPTIYAPSETGFVHVVISGAVNGGNPDPQAWFCLKAGSDGGTGGTSGWDIVESAGVQSGAFTNTIEQLQADTLYYARVYVTNDVGEAWSSSSSFTTLASPEQLTLDGDQQVDGSDPELVFLEASDVPLAGTGSSPANWTYDFSYYGASPLPVILGEHKLYCGMTGRDDTGTLFFDLNGGSLSGNHNTNAIVTYRGTATDSANVNIINVDDVDIGAIDARAGRTGWADASQTIYPGYIYIGTESNRAGHIRADYLYSFSFSGDDANAERGSRNVTLYGSGNVTIPGDIRTDTQGGSAGHVLIDHQGDLTAGTINADTRGYGVNYPYPGNVTLNGGDSSGDASVSGIQASLTSGKSNNTSTRRKIAVSNYNHVAIGPITARYEGSPDNGRFYGSHVEIEQNIAGNISISGAIDLRSYRAHSESGYLKLTCAGAITLAELDLDKVLHARLDSGSGNSTIEGAIADFDVSSPTGSGTQSDPYVSGETRLRAPEGQVVYYEYQAGTLNTDLGGDVWQLRNLDDSGDGGLLMVEPPSGTIFIVR